MIGQIFSVGTEILLGNITDSNSRFLANELAKLGIDVYKMVTVGDNRERLYEEMKKASEFCDYIFLSGGLGPTADDISKEVAIRLAKKEDRVEINASVKESLNKYFKNDKVALENNIKQAIFPKDAIILDNDLGTAPGCIIRMENNCKIILLPGPPREMTHMFTNKLLKYLEKNAVIESKILKIGLLGEWDMARRVDFSSDNPSISPYFADDGAYIRITAKANDRQKAKLLLENKEKELDEIFKGLIISRNGERKEKVLLDLLEERKEKISLAESITGGMIASSLVDIDGASKCLKEAYIVYSDMAKEKILNVSHETLVKYSAVSKESAKEMLAGLFEKTQADLCIITTGFAHLGLVYIGIKYKDFSKILKYEFRADRNKVRKFTRNRALDAAIMIMRGNYEGYFNF